MRPINTAFLKELCSIHAPSGHESPITDFLTSYILSEQRNWKVQPKVLYGGEFQDAIVLVFGEPRTAIFAHIDSIGYSVRYNNQLVRIGGPEWENGTIVVGKDEYGNIEGTLEEIDEKWYIKYNREIERGTTLTYKPNFREDANFVQSCYLDNRLGVYTALEVAKTLENGIIVLTTHEEHGGGCAGTMGRYIYENYNVRQALISDITWITEGVQHNKGVVISLRDSGIPRRTYVDKIIAIAKKHAIPYQLEVEGSGGSDGNDLQKSPYPFDWCFIGAAEDFVHSPNEKVHIEDIRSMIALYEVLMQDL